MIWNRIHQRLNLRVYRVWVLEIPRMKHSSRPLFYPFPWYPPRLPPPVLFAIIWGILRMSLKCTKPSIYLSEFFRKRRLLNSDVSPILRDGCPDSEDFSLTSCHKHSYSGYVTPTPCSSGPVQKRFRERRRSLRGPVLTMTRERRAIRGTPKWWDQ